jgi:nucleoid-associated protein YgaU
LTGERAFDHNRSMVRTRVRWGRLTATLVAAGLSVILLAGHAGAWGQKESAGHPAAVRIYVVQPGDTLWDIAHAVGGARGDPRPVVDALIAANHLRQALILPGQRLVVPESVHR